MGPARVTPAGKIAGRQMMSYRGVFLVGFAYVDILKARTTSHIIAIDFLLKPYSTVKSHFNQRKPTMLGFKVRDDAHNSL